MLGREYVVSVTDPKHLPILFIRRRAKAKRHLKDVKVA
jgi:hypothetical protein